MSGASEKLGRQIAGAQEIAVVVRSMKALAASSITQYETAVQSLEVYYQTIERGLSVCLRRLTPESDSASAAPPAGEAARPREAARPAAAAIGVIVFGSDQGLVGRFNEVLWEFAEGVLQSPPGKIGLICAIGDRMQELVAAIPAAQSPRAVPGSVAGITPLANALLIDIEAALAHGVVSEIRVFHNRPKAAALYDPVQEKLLPLDDQWQRRLASQPWPTASLPDIVGDNREAIEGFTREYLFLLLFRACAQSLCSENASRLAAMQRAEKNIDELRGELSRRYQRVRQEAIDEELFDVIAGYESLSPR